MKTEDKNKIEIFFADGSSKLVQAGISLLELSSSCQKDYISRIVAGKVDNEIKELNHIISSDCRIEFIDMTHSDGMRIYRRSLNFILIKAVKDLFPDREVSISHSISKGNYCEIIGDTGLTSDEVRRIEKRMKQLVSAQIPFVKRIMPVEEANRIFKKSGRIDRLYLIEHRTKPYVTIYNCDGLDDYFYGYMVPHTGYIDKFKLIYYPPGLIVLFPEKTNPGTLPEFEHQKKLFAIFREYKQWGSILGVENAGALNGMVKSNKISDFIKISEALHEKKIAQIADMITHSKQRKRIVLISGPSSSGKTTFAQRLSIQLRVNGLKPLTISLDDYFLDREYTPVDENGDLDFEALESIDVKLFNIHLKDLINNREIEIPVFNFPKGCREWKDRKLKMKDDQILIVEGIHGLNEKLTTAIPRSRKFKIYVSALTSMNIDDHNRIPSTDTRIVRRIVRDHQFRGCNSVDTIKRWSSVRRGEKVNVFPFQGEADIMFNSALIYELGVLKIWAEPLLAEISRTEPQYSEARRLIEFLSYFVPIESKEIPLNSIIREFIGGSSFC